MLRYNFQSSSIRGLRLLILYRWKGLKCDTLRNVNL